MNDPTPEQRRINANEARQLLENKHFKEAFEAVGEYLENKALSCDPDNKEQAQRVVIAKQIFVSIRREIERKLDDGYMAEVEIVELERKRRWLEFRR